MAAIVPETVKLATRARGQATDLAASTAALVAELTAYLDGETDQLPGSLLGAAQRLVGDAATLLSTVAAADALDRF